MLLSLPIGSTSKIVQIPIFDSSSTTGALLTGLVFNTASLTAYYNREGAAGAAVAIVLATATKGTWATGGFIAVDGTNMPGWYELHIPDAALASGAKSVSIHLKGATNMVPVPILIELTATSNQDAVRGGMTAMPNVASGSAGALIVSGTGTAALSVSSGLVTLAGVTHTGAVIPTVSEVTGLTAATVHADLDDIQTRLPAALVSGRMDSSVGAMAANVITAAATAADFSTEVRSLASGTSDSGTTTTMVDAARTEADTDYWRGQVIVFTSGTLLGQARLITAFNAATDTITYSPATTVAAGTHTYEIWPGSDAILAQLTHTGATVPTVTTLTGHTAQTGDSFARLGAPAGASVSADVAAVKVDTAAVKTKTDFLPSATAGAAGGVFIAGANAATSITTALTANVIGNVTGNVSGSVGSVTAGVTIAAGGVISGAHAAAELNSIADAILDRNMATGTDSGTDSTAVRTPRQALRALRNKAAIAAGTLTVYKEDDTTASFTAAIATTAGNPISSADPT